MSQARNEPKAEDGHLPETLPDESEEGLERDAYLEERKTLVEAEGEASKSLDKALITLSAGAFGLSLLFIYRVAPAPQAVGWLYIAWGGFVLSLVSILLSFLASQWAFRRAREILDDDFNNATDVQAGNGWSTSTTWATSISIASFICGVIAMAYFATQNL